MAQSRTKKIVNNLEKDRQLLEGASKEFGYETLEAIKSNMQTLIEALEDQSEPMSMRVMEIVKSRMLKWGLTWHELRNEGLEDLIHAKAHRLCFCPPEEKKECLTDLFAYAVMRWSRGFK